MDFGALKDPFPYRDIEWRVGRAGKSNKGIWAKVLAYITSRAIMDRLDDVCGPANWQCDFVGDGGHLRAGIGIRTDEGWVWKWDGTGRLDPNDGLSVADAGKGDHSLAFKRAAVQWGIGRYLYNLSEGWAQIHEHGAYYGKLPKKDGGDSFKWDPPPLPEWAQPGGDGRYEPPKADPKTGEIPELSEKPLSVEIEDLKNRALNAELIDAKGAAVVDARVRAGQEGPMREARDKLALLLEKAKTNTPETEDAAA